MIKGEIRWGRNKYRKSMRMKDQRVHSNVNRQLSSLFGRTLCLMATVCSIFLLNPTSSSVLDEHAPIQGRGRWRLPETLTWGRTWAPWGGGTGEDCCNHPQHVDVCVSSWRASGLSSRQVGGRRAVKGVFPSLRMGVRVRSGWSWDLGWSEQPQFCLREGRSAGSRSPPGSASSDRVKLFDQSSCSH